MTKPIAPSDPIRHAESQALQLAARCGFPKDFIGPGIDILLDAFGEQWLREQAGKLIDRGMYRAPEHPIGNMFHVAGDNNISELLELAVYIKRLSNVPRLDQVIQHMRNAPEYQTSLMQLAFGYRFRKIGAADLELEPAVDNGRQGDLAFRLDGRAFVVECYIPEPAADRPLDEIERAFRKMGEAAMLHSTSGRRVAVELRMKRPVDAQQRKALEQGYLSALREWKCESDLLLESDVSQIRVRRVAPTELEKLLPHKDSNGDVRYPTDATATLALSTVPEGELANIRLSRDAAREHRVALLAWAPKEAEVVKAVADRVDEIGVKISKKLAQTRRADAPCRFIIVGIPEALSKSADLEDALRGLQRKLIENHEGFAGAWIVWRVWKINFRFGYVGKLLGGKDDYAIPAMKFLALNRLEHEHDFLSDYT